MKKSSPGRVASNPPIEAPRRNRVFVSDTGEARPHCVMVHRVTVGILSHGAPPATEGYSPPRGVNPRGFRGAPVRSPTSKLFGMQTVRKDVDAERRSFALRMMTHMGVAADEREDLAHQTLLRFYTKGYEDAIEDESVARALLARIGYTVVVDAARRRRSMRDIDGYDVAVDDSDRDERVRWARELLRAARLDGEALDLLERRFGRGESLESIASAAGCHVNTVRRRLGATLERLRGAALSEEHANLTEVLK